MNGGKSIDRLHVPKSKQSHTPRNTNDISKSKFDQSVKMKLLNKVVEIQSANSEKFKKLTKYGCLKITIQKNKSFLFHFYKVQL